MLPEHKNPIFVSKRPKISKKSPILTQECQFCARKAGKWGSRSQKAHKNADFVLGGPHRRARSSSAEHGTSTERPSAAGNNHPKRNKTAWNEAQRPEAQRNATATQRTQHNVTQRNTRNTRNTTQHTQRNCNATQLHNGEQQKRRQPFGLSPLKIGGYLLSHMVVQYHRRK